MASTQFSEVEPACRFKALTRHPPGIVAAQKRHKTSDVVRFTLPSHGRLGDDPFLRFRIVPDLRVVEIGYDAPRCDSVGARHNRRKIFTTCNKTDDRPAAVGLIAKASD